MLSLTKPTLQQQAEIAIQTEKGNWVADPKLGSELYKVNSYKDDRESYLALRQSLVDAVAHLPVKAERWRSG